MLMADVLAVFFVVLGLLLAHLGVWLLARGLWNSHALRAEEQVAERPGLTVLAGVPPAAITMLVAIVLGQLGGPGKALSALVLAAFLLFAHAGLSGAIVRIGKKLGSESDTPWRAVFRGGVAMSLAYVFPVLGWFIVLPASVILGAGASTIALFRGLFESQPRRISQTVTVVS